jgi:hypothetical protein
MRIDEVAAAVATAVAAITPTPYVQVTGDAFVESDLPLPLVPQLQSATVQHLAFSVMIDACDNANTRRDTPGDVIRVASTVRVYIAYQIRAAYGLTDYRLHLRAAGDILEALNNESTWAADDDVVAMLVSAWAPTFTLADGGPPLSVASVTFRIEHNLSV